MQPFLHCVINQMRGSNPIRTVGGLLAVLSLQLGQDIFENKPQGQRGGGMPIVIGLSDQIVTSSVSSLVPTSCPLSRSTPERSLTLVETPP